MQLFGVSKCPVRWLHHNLMVVPVLWLTMVAVIAAPEMVVENKTFDIGKVVEGSADSGMVQFSIKNSGDAPLRIDEVSPISRCMKTIRVDSLIRPGASGKIEVRVNFDGFRTGQFTMGIPVFSNAEDNPADTLIVKMQFQRVIDYTESAITINAATTGRKLLVLSSDKPDLKVTGVQFLRDPEPSEKKGAAWQPVRPVTVGYTLSAIDSVRSDGYRVYRLDLVMPEIDRPMLGNFVIGTNHPGKREIVLRGTLLK